jgi:hypothetical protein
MLQFKKNERYYNVYEQHNLFGGITVICSGGTVDSKRGGNKKIFCDNQHEVEDVLKEIRSTRIKRGYIQYSITPSLTKEKRPLVIKSLRGKMTKDNGATRPILTLGSFNKNDTEKTVSDKASLLSLQKKQIINTEVLTPPTPATKEAPPPKIVDNKQAVAKSPAVTIDPAKEVVKKPKPKHFIDNEEYHPILKYLQEHYPKAFPTGKALVPLAIGIHVPILATRTGVKNEPFCRHFLINSYINQGLCRG